MAVYEGSRYIETQLKNFGTDIPLIGVRKPVQFNPKNCGTYIFQRGDRVDYIAHQVYGNAQLYWAILDANPQYFSELDIEIGDTILIPPYREVAKYLGL